MIFVNQERELAVDEALKIAAENANLIFKPEYDFFEKTQPNKEILNSGCNDFGEFTVNKESILSQRDTILNNLKKRK